MFCSGHRGRTGTAAVARLNPRAPSCPTGTRPAVKCSLQPSHRQGPLPCAGLDLRLSEGTFAIRDDHTRLSGQRGKMGSFSPKPPTARAQTVWISFRSYPNNLNNHQARFLLAPAVASGCSETNTNPICSHRVILEARDKLHPLQCCCQRPGSDPSNSPRPCLGLGVPCLRYPWAVPAGAISGPPALVLPNARSCPCSRAGERLWPPESYLGTGGGAAGSGAITPPHSPSLCQTITQSILA